MNRGWLELESDPGLFTLLVEDFGVQGIQVEEIYDLQKSIEGPVYGFIFLFRWIEERRSRRKITQDDESFVVDDDITNSMFFAHQVIPNSCATHALLSVLLNCENKIKLGEILTRLKQFTRSMNPEDKGLAIGNMPDLAKAHNSHARPEPCRLPEKQQGVSAGRIQEAFHYVSYVPINGHLFELDGLKPHPIDHGPGRDKEDWTETFRRVITERLGMATGGEPYHDIRFNLMAVVPDRRQHYEQKLKRLTTNRQIVLEALQQMVKMTSGGDLQQSMKPIVTRSVAAREAAAAAAFHRHFDSNEKIEREDDISTDDNKSYNHLSCNSDGRIKTEDDEMDSFNDSLFPVAKQLKAVEADGHLKIHISVSDGSESRLVLSSLSSLSRTDVTKPLLIQTKFSSLSPGSSTDTASEVASLLNSPASASAFPSPHLPDDVEKEVNIEGCCDDDDDDDDDDVVLSSAKLLLQQQKNSSEISFDNEMQLDDDDENILMKLTTDEKSKKSLKSKMNMTDGQGFTPKDLLSLLKNVESEISVCENNLRDEIEKRKKYKIDDCRRTHNYDQFICTFLKMLAEQGQLTNLVEQHMLTKRRQGVSAGRLHKIQKEKKKRGKRKR